MKLLFLQLLMILSIISFQNINMPIIGSTQIIPSWQASPMVKLDTNCQKIIALMNDNKIYNWNSMTLKSQTSVVFPVDNYYGFSLTYLDFSLDAYNSVAFNAYIRFAIVNLTANAISYTKQITHAYQYIENQLTQNVFFILNTIRQIQRYNRANYQNLNYQITQKVIKSSQSSTYHFAACQVEKGFQYIVIWNSCNAIELIESSNQAFTSIYNWTSTYPNCLSNINMIKFNNNCSLIIIQKDNLTQIQIFNILSLTIYTIIQKPTQTVYNVQFFDKQSQNVLVFYKNNSIVLYQLAPTIATYLGQFDSNISLNINSFLDINKRTLYRVHNLNIYITQLECAQGYRQSNKLPCQCIRCDNSTQNCTLVPQECIYSSIVPVVPEQPIKPVDPVVPQKPKQPIQPQTQPAAMTLLKPIFGAMALAASSTSVASQVLPITVLFIGFINYWSLISYYALISNIKKPILLNYLLNMIFQLFNSSIFQSFGINIDINTGLHVVNDGFLCNFGITTDFVAMHLQDLTTLFISFCTISFVLFIKSRVHKNSQIYKRLSFNFAALYLAQTIGLLPSFLSPFYMVLININRLYFGEKANIVPHLLCIGILFLVPFFALIEYKNTAKKQQKQSKNRLQNKRLIRPVFDSNQVSNKDKNNKLTTKLPLTKSKRQDDQLFYCGLCSLFLPFAIATDSKVLIFIVAIFIFTFGVYRAYKQEQFKINKIILASHILVFHLSFFFMIFCQKNQQLFNISGMVCTVWLILGATHETLNLIFEIFYSLHKAIILRCKPNKIMNIKNRIEISKADQKKQLKFKMERKKFLPSLHFTKLKGHFQQNICNKVQQMQNVTFHLALKKQNKQIQQIIKKQEQADKIHRYFNMKRPLRKNQIDKTISKFLENKHQNGLIPSYKSRNNHKKYKLQCKTELLANNLSIKIKA